MSNVHFSNLFCMLGDHALIAMFEANRQRHSMPYIVSIMSLSKSQRVTSSVQLVSESSDKATCIKFHCNSLEELCAELSER